MPQLSILSVLGASAVVVALGGGLAFGAIQFAESQDSCPEAYSSGSASELVVVENADAASPEIEFPTPLVTKDRQITLVSGGLGRPAYSGDYVDFDLTVFLGADETYLTSSSYDASNPVSRRVSSESGDFFGEVLLCQTAESQIVVTAELEDVFGPAVVVESGLEGAATAVLVIDIHQTFPGIADGGWRLPQAGLPSISQAPTGEHGLVFPSGEIPSELRVAILKKGSGAYIEEDDVVLANFTGAVWETKSVFLSSFNQGSPGRLIVTDRDKSSDGFGMLKVLADSLVGQTIGSQVLVSVPPEFGYREADLPRGVPKDTTLIFVFDLLGVVR